MYLVESRSHLFQWLEKKLILPLVFAFLLTTDVQWRVTQLGSHLRCPIRFQMWSVLPRPPPLAPSLQHRAWKTSNLTTRRDNTKTNVLFFFFFVLTEVLDFLQEAPEFIESVGEAERHHHPQAHPCGKKVIFLYSKCVRVWPSTGKSFNFPTHWIPLPHTHTHTHIHTHTRSILQCVCCGVFLVPRAHLLYASFNTPPTI